MLRHTTLFKYLFILFFVGSVLLNFYITNNDSFYIFFILSVILLGIGFYKYPYWFLFTITSIIVAFRSYLLSDDGPSLTQSLIHLLVYQLILLISVWLMRNYQEVVLSKMNLVKALANALDSRDPYTRNHSENVSKLSVKIAEKMGLPKKMCEEIRIGGLLHDIGKIGVPEGVLLKAGKLTEEEYESIKKHPTIGFQIIQHISEYSKNSVLESILYHHERYDGTGYPNGLKGEMIPLSARIVAIADTFDAMTSERVYRKERSVEGTLDEILKNKGRQFDPEITDVFLTIINEQFIQKQRK